MKALLMLILTIGLCAAEPMEFEELNGYKDVIVTKVLGDGIRIIHSGGARTIPAKELSPELQAKFGITELSIEKSKKDKELDKKAALNVFGLKDYDSEIAKRLRALENPAKLSMEDQALLRKEILLLRRKQYRARIVPESRQNGENAPDELNPATIRPKAAKPERDPFKRPKRGLGSDFKLGGKK